MDLDKLQKKVFAPVESSSKEAIAVSESMGMTHSFAKLAEKVENINLMLVPAMTSSGLVAGEVKDMYDGKGVDAKEIERNLSNIQQSIMVIGSLFEIPLSRIITTASKGN